MDVEISLKGSLNLPVLQGGGGDKVFKKTFLHLNFKVYNNQLFISNQRG